MFMMKHITGENKAKTYKGKTQIHMIQMTIMIPYKINLL